MLGTIFVTIIFQDVQHHCMAHVDGGEFALRTITIGAPSKTFNIPGGCVDIYIYIYIYLSRSNHLYSAHCTMSTHPYLILGCFVGWHCVEIEISC